MSHLLSFKQLAFNEAIRYPNTQIHGGEIVFITGPSGSGKSTLLRLINGTLTPWKGQVYFQQQDIATMDTISLRRQILLLSQHPHLFNGSIAKNFAYFHDFRQTPCPAEDQLNHYLSICQLDKPLGEDCQTLSGGERQRVFLAIGLSMMPTILLLDEPTSALDHQTAEQVMTQIIAFCRGHQITLVVVSHDQELTNLFAQKIIKIGGDC